MKTLNPAHHPPSHHLPLPNAFSTGYSSKKHFDSTYQQSQEELSIVEWIRQNFCEEFSHCRKINKIEDLFGGIALAQIVSEFLLDDQQKENLLNQIQIVQDVQSRNGREVAKNNLNAVINSVKEIFVEILENAKSFNKNDKSIVNFIKLVELTSRSLQNFTGQTLISNKGKMKNFILQIIMILPEILVNFKEIHSKRQPNQKLYNKNQNFMQSLTAHKLDSQYTYSKGAPGQNNFYESVNNNNIEQLSSIIGYSTVHNKPQRIYDYSSQKIESYEESNKPNEKLDQVQNETHQSDQQFQTKVETLLGWIQSTYKIDISQLMEPYLLLGQLVNNILAPNRLKDNEKPIKPIHYQLGSYAVYKKTLNLLTQVERLNKSNLIKLMKQVETGKVNETTFWNLIEDIQSMVKNKVSEQKILTTRRKPSKAKSVKKQTQQSEKVYTEYDENLNVENIKNQSVTELLQDNFEQKGKLKNAPLYDEDVIKQTQLWLQNEIGLGHSLNKSRPNVKTTILQNPLLNGTLYAKMIQRLKIGSAKGVVTPLDKKQLKKNLQVVKNEFLNRGYEVARKLDIYLPSYNFYIGLLSQIRATHSNKQSNAKKQISDDRQKKQYFESQTQIPECERLELERWLSGQFNETLQQMNGFRQISLKVLKTVIWATVNVNFLKETTQRIRLFNYIKLLEFFRSIGFSHYCLVKVEDIVAESVGHNKKTQNLRWIILRDLRIIRGSTSSQKQ